MDDLKNSSFIALDPGLATGVCCYTRLSGLSFCTMTKPQVLVLLDATVTEDTVLFVEKFEVRANTHKLSRQYEAMDLHGYADGVAFIRGARFQSQVASHAKGFCNKEMLERFDVGLDDDHQVSALQHMVAGVASHGPELWEDLIEWLMPKRKD